MDLQLICIGSGSSMQEETTDTEVRDKRNNTRVESSTMRRQEFKTTIRLKIEGNQAQINLPQTILPLISAVGKEWRPVKNLAISNTEISGQVSINWLSDATFSVNRTTGVMRYETMSANFMGDCVPQDNNPATKKF